MDKLFIILAIGGGLYYFLFTGPSKEDLADSSRLIANVICNTDTIAQLTKAGAMSGELENRSIREIALLNDTKLADSLRAVYKNMQTALYQSRVPLSTFDDIHLLKPIKRSLFLQSVADDVSTTCPGKVKDEQTVLPIASTLLGVAHQIQIEPKF